MTLSMIELAASQRANLFKLLDEYARAHHRCCLTEMFLNQAKTNYFLCFRPVGKKLSSTDRYACSYVQISLPSAVNASDSTFLDEALTKLLDSKLELLNPLSGENH
jgi:hypothetical protein